MKKHIIFLLLFFSVQLQSQTTEEFPLLPKGLKSPTSADLGHCGEIPMSYYTGQSCLKIPVYSTRVQDVLLDISDNNHNTVEHYEYNFRR